MSIANLLAQTGSPSASFPTVGTRVAGKVVRADVMQQTDIKTREPLWWDDQHTRPKQLVAITVDTGIIDPAVADDTGHRTIYVKAWGAQFDALKAAVSRAGAKDVNVDDTFSATFTGTEKATTAGLSDTKLMTYELQPGSAVGAMLDAGTTPPPVNMGTPAQQQAAAPAPQPAPVAAPPAAPAPQAPPAAPTAPPADPYAAIRGDVQAWRAKGWSNEQLADPAVGAAFPHSAFLQQIRATGADPVAVLAAI